MSLYTKQFMNKKDLKYSRIKNILDGPIIRGCKPIYNKDEKLQRTKPHNEVDYKRQFRKYGEAGKEMANRW